MSQLHVLAFEEAAGFGGAFIGLSHIVEHLVGAGAGVTIARSYDGACWDRPSLASANLLPIHRVLGLPRRVADDRPAGHTIRLAAAGTELVVSQLPQAIRFARLARSANVNLIFLNNTPMVNLVGVLTGALSGIPVIAYLQGHQYPARLLRRLIPRVSHFLGVSDYISREIRDLGVPPERIGTLYHGITPPPLRGPRPADGRIRVGMIGMLTKWKGQLAFLEAFDRAARQEPTLDAWLFGGQLTGEESYAEEVRRAIRRPGLEGRIRLIEDRSDPDHIFQHIDVAVHCSLEPEPLGRVVIEAMSYGRPTIAAASGGPLEIIRHSQTGFLVDPEDSDALAQQIVQLARDEGLRRKLGEAARLEALTRFTYPSVLAPLWRAIQTAAPQARLGALTSASTSRQLAN